MPVVSLVVELRLVGCGTSRQKRQLVEAILGKLRTHFNVSAAEVGREDPAPDAVAAFGFAAVARTRRDAKEVLERVVDAVSAHPRADVVKVAFDEL